MNWKTASFVFALGGTFTIIYTTALYLFARP